MHVDLRNAAADGLVFHFSTRSAGVDATYFGKWLQHLQEAAISIARSVTPETDFDLLFDGAVSGSLRIKLRLTPRAKTAASAVAIGIVSQVLGNVIYENYLSAPDKIEVHISGDVYVQSDGENELISSASVLPHLENARQNEEVRSSISGMFRALRAMPRVKSFGLAPSLDVNEAALEIPFDQFYRLEQHLIGVAMIAHPQSRFDRHHDQVAVLQEGFTAIVPRKCAFSWGELSIKAAVSDTRFIELARSKEMRFRKGDTFRVDLDVYSPTLAAKDKGNWYVIARVLSHPSSSNRSKH